ncbi:SGNH/GDSL hydrolase family protein [Mediterraneibacter agrestimuris]|uniref:SGNH/GDSL hydrolase family protein n=1 Tax=Mediterraneibacter agrestimuris TaxID=2941333 RepID=UPI00203FD72D|nr:SGNH/GDSL hydrolase family protein [Mediterraneibacter agrestimuris]
MKRMNLARLKGCMQRAQRGEELVIGFLGGSITQGSLASEHENCYAYRVFQWWQENFPAAESAYVNGGIGGTDSLFGVSRAVTDVLMYQPDVVIVDFSVNDKENEFYQETYEGVIRKILTWKSKPAVILLNNVFYDTGENAQEYHNAIGDWYHVPHVSVKDTLYQKMKSGMYTREELTSDGLHPNDKGHKLVAAEIISFLDQVKEHKSEWEAEVPLPLPMTANAYENAKRLTIREISPKLSGFQTDTAEKTGHLDFFKNGWIGKRAGDKILFEIEASCIAIQYRKTIKKPALRAKLVLDGESEKARILDGNFEEDWGDCLYLEPILHHGEHKKHIVEIEIIDDGLEKSSQFYLLSLIIA